MNDPRGTQNDECELCGTVDCELEHGECKECRDKYHAGRKGALHIKKIKSAYGFRITVLNTPYLIFGTLENSEDKAIQRGKEGAKEFGIKLEDIYGVTQSN